MPADIRTVVDPLPFGMPPDAQAAVAEAVAAEAAVRYYCQRCSGLGWVTEAEPGAALGPAGRAV